ncbi:hypothetical protein TRVL_09212 [Trypanosoma vivax]|nr:hypothetical protein TRVL_09212 [Trypanosoma vivax]
MSLRFNLGLLAAILLNGAVLGDDSTSSDALAGAGERNAPSRGGDAGRKSEGRARNGDKLVVLDSARTTPSETVRKSVSVMRRMSGQSSLRNRNEARNDHVGVGNELPDQPATSHKAQASAGDKHGMKLPHARHPAASRHGEGGLTSKNPKESAEAVDRKKEFESMVSGIIAEDEAEVLYKGDNGYPVGAHGENYDGGYSPPGGGDYDYGPLGGGGEPGSGVPTGGGPSVSNTSTPGPASRSTSSAPSSSDGGQSTVMGNKDKGNANDGSAPEDVQEKKGENEREEKEEDGKEKEKIQLDEQKSNGNSDGRETNNSSEENENEEAPSTGSSAFLCGSYSSVLLVAVACICACPC